MLLTYDSPNSFNPQIQNQKDDRSARGIPLKIHFHKLSLPGAAPRNFGLPNFLPILMTLGRNKDLLLIQGKCGSLANNVVSQCERDLPDIISTLLF